jgi:hypothetical protein
MNTQERDALVAVRSQKNREARERLEALRASNLDTAVATVLQQNAILGEMSEGWAQTKRDNLRLIEQGREAELMRVEASAQMRQVQGERESLTERVSQLELALSHAQRQLVAAQNEEANSRANLVESNLNLTRELAASVESEQAAQLALSVQLSTMVAERAASSGSAQVDTLVDANRVLECKLRESREEVRQVSEENAKIPRLQAQLAEARRC